MIQYVVYNTETGSVLFCSSKLSECRIYAKSYSKDCCTPCTIMVVFNEEHYVNGQKKDV